MLLWHLSLGFFSPPLDYNAFDFTFVASGACCSSLALWCVSKGRISATFPFSKKYRPLLLMLKEVCALMLHVAAGCEDVALDDPVTAVSCLIHVILWRNKGVRQDKSVWLVGWLCFSSLDSSHQQLTEESSWDLLQPQQAWGIHCSGGEKLCWQCPC